MLTRTEPKMNIEPWNLLDHPFYQSWNAGTLPQSALETYAEEYGAFIKFMPQGWNTLNDIETAHEEEEHIALWGEFAEGLNTSVSTASIKEVVSLTESTQMLFSEEATAIGALYAFEVQQPETANTKLAGLKQFYDLPSSTETYFQTHSHNEHEAEKLLALYDGLDIAEQQVAREACTKMSEAMWDALTGIYDQECVQHP